MEPTARADSDVRRRFAWLLWWVLAIPAPSLAGPASPLPQFAKADNIHIAEGESRTGDLYVLGNSIEVNGVQHGDLLGFAQAVIIAGEIDGDVFTWSQSVTISGTVRDSARVGAQTATITGTIEGDLLVFAGVVNVARQARITGNLRAFGGQVSMLGDVGGDLHAAGGELNLGGTVGGDVDVKFDVIQFQDSAKIAGNLTYSARKEADLAGREIAAGAVTFDPHAKKPKEPEAWITSGDVMWWLWRVASALVIGALLLALFRRPVTAIGESVGREPLLGGLIGFGSFILVPVAAVIACLLVVTLPLGIIALLLYVIAVWIAKLAVALWAGGWLLRRLGRPTPSPFAALLLGLPLVYLAFEVPYVHWFVWLVVTWLGLGAMVLGLRGQLRNGAQPIATGGAAAPAVETDVAPPA